MYLLYDIQRSNTKPFSMCGHTSLDFKCLILIDGQLMKSQTWMYRFVGEYSSLLHVYCLK